MTGFSKRESVEGLTYVSKVSRVSVHSCTFTSQLSKTLHSFHRGKERRVRLWGPSRLSAWTRFLKALWFQTTVNQSIRWNMRRNTTPAWRAWFLSASARGKQCSLAICNVAMVRRGSWWNHLVGRVFTWAHGKPGFFSNCIEEQHSQRRALPTFFHIHKHADANDWPMLLWSTGGRKSLPLPLPAVSFSNCGNSESKDNIWALFCFPFRNSF